MDGHIVFRKGPSNIQEDRNLCINMKILNLIRFEYKFDLTVHPIKYAVIIWKSKGKVGKTLSTHIIIEFTYTK